MNTDVGIGTGFNQEGYVEFRGNIVQGSQATVQCWAGGVVECNDVWPDSTALVVDCCGIVTRANLNADPLFCDALAGDFQIAEESPCAPANAPEGCGGIGALGVGCSINPVAKTTWGKLKYLFR